MENRAHTTRWPPRPLPSPPPPLPSPPLPLPSPPLLASYHAGKETSGVVARQRHLLDLLHWQSRTPTFCIFLLMSLALLCTLPRTAYSITRTFRFMFSRVRAFFSWPREVVMHLALRARKCALTDHLGYANAIRCIIDYLNVVYR